jgi:hypothetical protein
VVTSTGGAGTAVSGGGEAVHAAIAVLAAKKVIQRTI